MLVHATPEHMEAVKDKIEQLPGTEIYGDSDNGKIVVVLETSNQNYITDVIEKIHRLPFVLSTALVYHQIEYPDTFWNDRL